MKKKHFLILLTFLIMSSIYAQQIPQTFRGKTHMLNRDELKQLNKLNRAFNQTNPPAGNVRSIAEFEKMEGVIIAYKSYYWGSEGYFGLPINVIAEIAEDVIIYTIVKDVSTKNTVTSIFTSNGVNLNNVVFVIAPVDSYWSRDYGPWFYFY